MSQFELPPDLPVPEDDGEIEDVIYPVFPPDAIAAEALARLRA